MDPEPDTLKVPSAPKLPTFDLEDPFSDGDDGPLDYKFSPSLIREDLKTFHPTWGQEEDDSEPSETEDSEVHPESESVNNSPFQLPPLANTDDEPYSEVQSPQSPDEPSGTFVQISLSVSEPAEDELQEASVVDDVAVEENQQQAAAEQSQVDFNPPVLIDASKSPAHRVTLSTDGRSWKNHSIPELKIPSRSSSGSPPLSAHSTRSLPSTPKPEGSDPPKTSNSASAVSPGPSPPASLPPTSPPLLEIPKPPGTRPKQTGPSALEKYRSKTRPSFLPPKARQEDDKHMADWQTMMKHSRTAAEKRRKALQERRTAREKKVEESQHIWEKEIVSNWKVVHKNPQLRKLWWKGIPTKLRASMWERAVGNPLALSKDNFRSCLARANRAFKAGTFPEITLALLEEDISNTLPALHIFHKETGPLYSDLKDILYAWIVSRADEGLGYTAGAAKIAGMLLISIPPQQAFVVMRNLLERHCLRSFFGGDGAREDVDAYYRIFDTLLADGMPKIYFNFKQHQISPSAYLPDWIMSLFIEHLPFEACARIWDVILLEGDSFLFRAALGILAVLEPRLFFPDRKELIELLRGENKAAIDVARRDGQSLDGGKYEIYGVDEETLWERIDSMDDWWRESTWTRLIQRELPDR